VRLTNGLHLILFQTRTSFIYSIRVVKLLILQFYEILCVVQAFGFQGRQQTLFGVRCWLRREKMSCKTSSRILLLELLVNPSACNVIWSFGRVGSIFVNLFKLFRFEVCFVH